MTRYDRMMAVLAARQVRLLEMLVEADPNTPASIGFIQFRKDMRDLTEGMAERETVMHELDR